MTASTELMIGHENGEHVILRALSLDPTRRHRDACAFISDLREALERPAHRTTSTRRIRVETPKRRKPRAGVMRGTRRMWSVAGAALVLAPVVAYGLASLAGPSTSCHASYADACLKPDSPDYDCTSGGGDGPDYIGRTVRVIGPDVYNLDGDGDGVAC